MFNQKRPFYFKILIALVIGFLFANIAIQSIFLANTPRMRPNLISYITSEMRNLILLPGSLLARLLQGPSIEEQLAKIPFNPVAQGVYAKAEGTTSLKLYKEDEVKWSTVEFDHLGKHYSIRYSLSDGRPNVELFKTLLNK